jgi:hypothetical protein
MLIFSPVLPFLLELPRRYENKGQEHSASTDERLVDQTAENSVDRRVFIAQLLRSIHAVVGRSVK